MGSKLHINVQRSKLGALEEKCPNQSLVRDLRLVGPRSLPTERLHVSVSDPSEPPSHRQSPEIYHFLRRVANQRIWLRKKIGNLFIRLCVQAEDAHHQNMQHLNNLIPDQNSSRICLNEFQVALIRENGPILHLGMCKAKPAVAAASFPEMTLSS